MTAERVRKYLMENGVSYQIQTHAVAYTTSEVAEAQHVPGRQMAKPVILMADDRLVMAVLPGDRMINVAKARDALHANTVRLATEDEFSGHFADCERGAEPPFGALYDMPMIVDQGLDSPQITFNAGNHTETLTIAYDDFERLTVPQRVDLAS